LAYLNEEKERKKKRVAVMPLSVEIKINGISLETIHIGRMASGGTRPNDINNYLVVNGQFPSNYEAWNHDGVQFQHRYGDGAVECVRLALQALKEKI
jgi:hypothetical protein